MQRRRENLARERLTISHPRDRRVRQLNKKEKRNQKLEQQKAKREGESAMLVLRCAWFREQCLALGYAAAAVPPETTEMLALLYVERNAPEMAELRSLRNAPTGRIRKLEALHAQEVAQLRGADGMTVPNLADGDDVEILTDIWDGAADTVSVVPTTQLRVTAERQQELQRGDGLAELAARLRPIEELRERRAVPQPRGMLAVRKRISAALARANKTGRDGASAGKKRSTASAKSITAARDVRRAERQARVVERDLVRRAAVRDAKLARGRQLTERHKDNGDDDDGGEVL